MNEENLPPDSELISPDDEIPEIIPESTPLPQTTPTPKEAVLAPIPSHPSGRPAIWKVILRALLLLTIIGLLLLIAENREVVRTGSWSDITAAMRMSIYSRLEIKQPPPQNIFIAPEGPLALAPEGEKGKNKNTPDTAQPPSPDKANTVAKIEKDPEPELATETDIPTDAPQEVTPPAPVYMEPSADLPWKERSIDAFLPNANIVIYARSAILLLRSQAETVRIYRNLNLSALEGAMPSGLYRIIGRTRTEKPEEVPLLVLNYPGISDADKALKEERIGNEDHKRICIANEKGNIPPADTPLGGPMLISAQGVKSQVGKLLILLPLDKARELYTAAPEGTHVLIVDR